MGLWWRGNSLRLAAGACLYAGNCLTIGNGLNDTHPSMLGGAGGGVEGEISGQEKAPKKGLVKKVSE